ncbi:MAG: class I SAM-dependent methyltransferase [Pseudomonadota bacterium]
MTNPNCGVCSAELPNPIAGFEARHRVTSDCKPFGPGGKIAQCEACGVVQKPNDAQWRADCNRIYGAYDNYSLTGGVEQSVRGGPGGRDYAPRSDLVLGTYADAMGLPENGRMLDYGCGKGPTTKAADRILQDWTIDGYDLDRRAEETLGAIPSFGTLYTGDPADIPHRYDLIILMHALEHIPDGHSVLRGLGELLTPNGHIVIQVPNRLQNPFDLLVADHTLHFDRGSLYAVGARSGLAPMVLSEDWVVKELSMVLGHGEGITEPAPVDVPAVTQVAWLEAVVATAREAAQQTPFGIFGTSITGTWLAAEIGRAPDFWIDEDAAKQGVEIDGAPVLAPDTAPPGAAVLMAMAPRVAATVAARLAHLDLIFVAFPAEPR